MERGIPRLFPSTPIERARVQRQAHVTAIDLYRLVRRPYYHFLSILLQLQLSNSDSSRRENLNKNNDPCFGLNSEGKQFFSLPLSRTGLVARRRVGLKKKTLRATRIRDPCSDSQNRQKRESKVE